MTFMSHRLASAAIAIASVSPFTGVSAARLRGTPAKSDWNEKNRGFAERLKQANERTRELVREKKEQPRGRALPESDSSSSDSDSSSEAESGSDAAPALPAGQAYYPLDDVAKHTTKHDCRVVVDGKVVNANEFIPGEAREKAARKKKAAAEKEAQEEKEAEDDFFVQPLKEEKIKREEAEEKAKNRGACMHCRRDVFTHQPRTKELKEGVVDKGLLNAPDEFNYWHGKEEDEGSCYHKHKAGEEPLSVSLLIRKTQPLRKRTPIPLSDSESSEDSSSNSDSSSGSDSSSSSESSKSSESDSSSSPPAQADAEPNASAGPQPSTAAPPARGTKRGLKDHAKPAKQNGRTEDTVLAVVNRVRSEGAASLESCDEEDGYWTDVESSEEEVVCALLSQQGETGLTEERARELYEKYGGDIPHAALLGEEDRQAQDAPEEATAEETRRKQEREVAEARRIARVEPVDEAEVSSSSGESDSSSDEERGGEAAAPNHDSGSAGTESSGGVPVEAPSKKPLLPESSSDDDSDACSDERAALEKSAALLRVLGEDHKKVALPDSSSDDDSGEEEMVTKLASLKDRTDSDENPKARIERVRQELELHDCVPDELVVNVEEGGELIDDEVTESLVAASWNYRKNVDRDTKSKSDADVGAKNEKKKSPSTRHNVSWGFEAPKEELEKCAVKEGLEAEKEFVKKKGVALPESSSSSDSSSSLESGSSSSSESDSSSPTQTGVNAESRRRGSRRSQRSAAKKRQSRRRTRSRAVRRS